MKRFDVRFCERLGESWEGIDATELRGFLSPKCQQINTVEGLREKLEEKRQLRVKFGIDPTASKIHLGHIVPMMVLRQLARSGMHIDLVIGDFTAQIGDPSGRTEERTALSKEEIAKNTATYSDQVGRYIEPQWLELHYNSNWLSLVSLEEAFTLLQQINLAEAIQRDDFRARMNSGRGVSLAEVCYGVLMGIDSVHLQTDIEIGGVDQLLNFQQCKKIMCQSGLREEVALMTPVIEGISGDGKKMSKSYNNYISVDASSEMKFGQIMSIPDRLIGQYFKSFADVHEREVGELEAFIEKDPFEAKKQLATFVVALESNDIEMGLNEREAFARKFSRKEISADDCITLVAHPHAPVFETLMSSGEFKSKSELRRLFEQNAVRFVGNDQERVLEVDTEASELWGVIRVGKRRFFNLQPKRDG